MDGEATFLERCGVTVVVVLMLTIAIGFVLQRGAPVIREMDSRTGVFWLCPQTTQVK
jgi:hypothetical protein